mmetsp:Transcript_51920/g.118387  ORF Transcript_51920/g.118387 Transcript_51920/m.118387 type:complete len:226 (-) Transcript_51920:3340-4017(-)
MNAVLAAGVARRFPRLRRRWAAGKIRRGPPRRRRGGALPRGPPPPDHRATAVVRPRPAGRAADASVPDPAPGRRDVPGAGGNLRGGAGVVPHAGGLKVVRLFRAAAAEPRGARGGRPPRRGAARLQLLGQAVDHAHGAHLRRGALRGGRGGGSRIGEAQDTPPLGFLRPGHPGRPRKQLRSRLPAAERRHSRAWLDRAPTAQSEAALRAHEPRPTTILSPKIWCG